MSETESDVWAARIMISFPDIWAVSWQNQQNDCAPSEDSDQPGHPPSLIRVFAVRMKKAWVLSYPLSAQRRLWSDWADAQADPNLRWAHSSFCLFCRAVAHLVLTSMINSGGLFYLWCLRQSVQIYRVCVCVCVCVCFFSISHCVGCQLMNEHTISEWIL